MLETPSPLPLSHHRATARARKEQATDGGTPALNFITVPSLQGRPVPEREWIVDDWLPIGCATLNYGDGGTGKTLLAQQLMTSCATGLPFLGLAVKRCRSIALFCEDSEAELHRRQDKINRAYGIDFDDLDDMTWASAIGADNCLVRCSADAKPAPTARFADLRSNIVAFGARLIVIDTAADTFAGNENDRAQVRGFVGIFNRMAEELQAAILINAHPSRTGLASNGDMDGGSTAWSNTARARWSLARPQADDGLAPDANDRILTRRKSNYSTIGDTLKLTWRGGALMPTNGPNRLDAMAAQSECDDVFMALLAKVEAENRPVTDCRTAGNSASRIFSQRPDRQGFSRQDFEGAMQRLFAAGKIRMTEYGRSAGRGRPRKITPAEGGEDA
jgi:RecA-family ATPase